MNLSSRTSRLRIVFGSFEMPNLSTVIVDRIDFEEYNRSIPANCISNLTTVISMFWGKLTVGDETPCVIPTLTCSYQQQYVIMQIVLTEINLPSFEYSCHNYKD